MYYIKYKQYLVSDSTFKKLFLPNFKRGKYFFAWVKAWNIFSLTKAQLGRVQYIELGHILIWKSFIEG